MQAAPRSGRARASLHMSVELSEWLSEEARRMAYEVPGTIKADIVDAVIAAGRAAWPQIEAEIRASRQTDRT